MGAAKSVVSKKKANPKAAAASSQSSSSRDRAQCRVCGCEMPNEQGEGQTGGNSGLDTCPQCSTKEAAALVPPWWQMAPTMDIKSSMLSPVPRKVEKAIQKLLDDSWRDAVTRDRRDSSKGHKPPRFKLVKVQHNHNPMVWLRYVRAREKLRSHPCDYVDILTNGLLREAGPDLLGSNVEELNEALLFHGTNPSACDHICKDGFSLKLAGSRFRLLYGPGTYFGENGTKSDEYALEDPLPVWKGVYAMLLCRVSLGRVLYTDARQPDWQHLVGQCQGPKAKFDSVLGDREKAVGTYREFVIYDSDRAYPEYVLIYRRMQDEDDDNPG